MEFPFETYQRLFCCQDSVLGARDVGQRWGQRMQVASSTGVEV